MTLALYFSKRFIVMFIRVLTIVALLSFIIDALENIRRLGSGAIGTAANLSLLHLPSLLVDAMPIIMMLAGLGFCVGLARSSEFVVSRAAGLSALHSLWAPIACAFLIGVVGITIFDPLSARLDEQSEKLTQAARNGNQPSVSVSETGLWVRQPTDVGHAIIQADEAADKGNTLRNVTAVLFDANGVAATRYFAPVAFLSESEWVFTRVKIWDVSGNATNPEADARTQELLRLPTNITPTQILDGYPKPKTINIFAMPRVISQIKASGFSTTEHQVQYQMDLAWPFLLVAMMIIGAVFALKNARMGNLGISVLLALISGFSLHFLQNFAKTLGDAGEVSAFVVAWFPPIAALLLALSVFLHLEDG